MKKALSLSLISRFEPDARRLGVSVVARSKRGFMTAFRRAGGRLSRLSPYWKKRRENFIKRHYAQVLKRKEPLFKNGKPTRRHLALIFWAWSPTPQRIKKSVVLGRRTKR